MQVPAPIDYLSLNSELNIYGPDGRIQFAKDREAVRGYFLEHVNPNTVFFHNLEEKLEYLVANGYYEAAFLAQYRPAFVKELFKAIYARRYRFTTFVGAYKFFTGYALKTFDGSRYLERYEDRIVVCALYLARGSEKQARLLAEEMIAQRFQPATPTFLNSGKAQRGELVSCFPAGTPVETTEGPKAIELIRVGDTVITHDGSAKAVTDVMERANEEGLVALSITGVSDVYYSTPEHPVLVHRPGAQHDLRPCLVGDGDQTDVWWVRAGDVQQGDLLAIDPRRIGEATAEEDVAALAVPSNVATLERPSRSKAARAAAGAQTTEVLRVIAGHLMAPVTKARRTPRAPITVYNLEVEDNHTYLARGVVVHNCFLIQIEDSMNSIGRAVNSALQLSKRGGGVAFSLSNLRGAGDPIKNIEDQSSGVLPVMKLLEDCFSYADQLGARQGAGAVYLHAHHWDIETFLDCRREAADEKIRIKTLSLGVVVPDITFELARGDEDMYLFSPYDVARKYGKPFSDVVISDVYRELVDDPGVRKRKIKARAFFQLLAEVQFESGYPYLLFEDNANRASAVPGRIVMSNLCSEILQPQETSEIDDEQAFVEVGKDVSCNLGSLNVSQVMAGPDIRRTIDAAIRALSAVSDMSDISCVPTIQAGNRRSHAVGLGQMNLHGYLASQEIHYDSPEAVDFVDAYFRTVAYHALWTSSVIARETGESFDGFTESDYHSGAFFERYAKAWRPRTAKVRRIMRDAGIELPSVEDWARLARHVRRHGMYNQNLQAIAPTGSISYVNHATASIHPITSMIEMRKEGKMGRVYYPAAHLNDENAEYFRDAYEIGPYALIDVYAAAAQHVDQGLSCTLFFTEEASTRDINRAQIYAWRKGLKTLYYVRVRSAVLEGTDTEGCVSCAV